MDDSRIFAYIDGVPTKGCWIDIDELTDDDDVRSALAESGVFDAYAESYMAQVNLDTEGEQIDLDDAREIVAGDYGGDILVADAEGLARHFMGRYGSFDWDEFKEWAGAICSRKLDEDAVEAFFGWMSTTDSVEYFEEAYLGTHKSAEDWAEEFMSDCYDIPEHLVNYIDYAKFVRDCECDGHYFADVPGGVAVFRSH